MKIEINSKNRELREILTKKESDTLTSEEVNSTCVSLLSMGIAAKLFDMSEDPNYRAILYKRVCKNIAQYLTEVKDEG